MSDASDPTYVANDASSVSRSSTLYGVDLQLPTRILSSHICLPPTRTASSDST